MIPVPQQLAQVQDLYDRGLCLQAFAMGNAIAPLKRWEGTSARILAGRLAVNLGAPRLGRAIHARAFRADRGNPEAIYYFGFERVSRGPLVAWEYLTRHGELSEAPPSLRADWLALKSSVACLFRDFDTAEAALNRAMELGPQRAWLWVERSSLLEAQDRYEEALAAARKGLELRPWYRPAVQATAHALQLLDRDDEALALLVEADQNIESAPVLAQLAALQCEMQKYGDARHSYDRFERLSPMIEKDVAQWLLARRCDVAYYLGDRNLAVQLAGQIEKSPFHEKIAKKLAESNGQARRVLLDIPFVRQHHMTCAPATLSAISRFWSMPADHFAVVESICYDGTPAHSERNWAGQNGWVAREFTVTWDSTVALIDRGIPFTLTTVEPISAHLQSVVGYDAFRGTLLVRDPYQYYVGEAIAEGFFERYRATGPRGMVMVPKDRSHRLEGVDLPDADLYDLLYEVQSCLVTHDRDGANRACEQMQAQAPGHRLTLSAHRSLAAYDQDATRGLACVEELLKLYPDDGQLLLSKIGFLRSTTRREELLELLKQITDRKGSDPVFWQRYADELQADARQHRHAEKLLRKAIRYRGRDAWNYFVLAGMWWNQRRFEPSLDLYRFSACLEDKDDGFAHAFFVACRHFRQTEPAIRLLRGRFERFGKRSSQSARSLFRALEDVERTVEAFATLEEALRLRRDDGDLQLFAALAHARHGNFDQAQMLLDAARGRTRRSAWLAAAANLSRYRGQNAASLDLWKQVLEVDPLAMEAHQHVAQLVAETESRQVAIDHLRAAAEKFPHHSPLQQLRITWLREEPPQTSEPVIRVLIANQPADAWAKRELALNLTEQNRLDEAMSEADSALNLDPTNPACHFVRGRVLARLGKLAQARDAQQQAIRYSVDADYAIGELMSVCETSQQRREALKFVREELSRQTIFGDGLLAYRTHAANELDPTELHDALKRTLDDRPDLWHAWSAVIAQLTEMNRADKAVAFARDATERFPLLPKLWVDLSHACRAAGDSEGEIAALREAIRINPSWGYAARELAGAFDRGGDFTRARELLQSALTHSPLDPYNHGCLADILWKTGEKDAAMERIQQAVRLEPGYRWAWDTLRAWSVQMGKSDLAVQLARELTERRGGEARSWLVLANLLDDPKDADARLAALDRAIELSPRAIDAHDQRAFCLARMGRFDEASRACAPAVFGNQLPVELLARSSWVEHERGNVRQAIDMLKAFLTEAPQSYGAWRWLADWYREVGDAEHYLETARTLARLWPLDPFAQGYLADAKLRTDDRKGAKEDLRRAVQLAPDYIYGITTLFDLELEDNQLDEAQKTLAILNAQIGGYEAILRELQLASKRGERELAAAKLAQLATSSAEDRWYFDNAVSAMSARGWISDVDGAFDQFVAHDKANPAVPRLAVERQIKRGKWRVATRLIASLQSNPESQAQAMMGLMTATAEKREKRRGVKFIREHRERLLSDSRLWGLGGYLLLELGKPWRAIEWLNDFQSRPDVKPWMLQNMVVALESVGLGSKAAQVALHALELPPDNSTPPLRVWAAHELSLNGNLPQAESSIRTIDRAGLTPYYQFLRDLVEARLLLHTQHQPSSGGHALPKLRELVRRAERTWPTYRQQRELRRAYTRLMRAIARRAGIRTPLWCWWRLGGPTLTIIFLIALGVGIGLWRGGSRAKP